MAETPTYYGNQNLDPYVINFSGAVTSTIRSSFQILGNPLGLQTHGFDIDITNYAIADYNNEKIWYMSGQYTSTVKNSTAQPATSYLTVSLDIFNTFAIGSGLAGDSSEMIYLSGKVTTTIKATFQSNNQSIYPGSNAPRCGVTVGPIASDKPVFWVEPGGGVKTYYRLASFFSSVVEDAEAGESIDVSGNVNVALMSYDGQHILWASIAATTQFHKTTYFGSEHVAVADVSKPAFITNAGVDGLSNGTWLDRYVVTHNRSLSSSFAFDYDLIVPAIFTPAFQGGATILSFGQQVLGGLFAPDNDFGLSDTVTQSGSIFNRSFIHTLLIDQLVSQTLVPVIEDGGVHTITFGHSVELTLSFIITHTLTLGQVASAPVEDEVPLEQSFAFSAVLSHAGSQITYPVSHDFIFGKTTAFWLIDTSDCTYDPQPPRAIEFPLVQQGFVRLQDDLPSPVNTIDIRSPNLGNTEDIEVFRVLNVSRSRDYSVFRDPAWPINRTIKIVSSENTQAESVTLLAFLVATAGQIIRLVDWEGRHWLGVVTNPNTAVQDLGNCRFQFNIDFIGDLTETNVIGQNYNRSVGMTLNFGQTLYRQVICHDDDSAPVPCTRDGGGFPIGPEV